MRLRTPLARARGLGIGHHGTHHWWAERLSALALVPLVPWFAISLARLTGADHATVAAWLGRPLNTVLTLLLIGALFHHAQHGVQVVIEDYVHSHARKLAAQLAAKAATALFGVAAAFAVLKVALGG